jgi:acyl-CoA thioester hydrolase
METRPQPLARAEFAHFLPIPTRWADNDAYGHVNNVVYYAWFDTVVNRWMIEQGLLDIRDGRVIGLVVETRCNYFASLAFPEPVEAGLRILRIGATSIVWQIGIFGAGHATTAALGHFVHVTVDAQSRRPVEVPPDWRDAMRALEAPHP